jgi:DnaJ-class molecular chaperone
VIKTRWRALVKQHHPDCGGDADHFRLVHEAYTCLTVLPRVSSQNTSPRAYACPGCRGHGMRREHHGFMTVTWTCMTCGGSGYVSSVNK